MADVFYGMAVGGQMPADVTEDTSTTSDAIELRVTSGTVTKDAILAVKGILAYLETKETVTVA